MGGGHDEREQTLNQLLVEMDGFDSKSGIIMIAATNRAERRSMLPSASWTGSWSSATVSFTSSPSTTPMRSPGSPSRTASAATARTTAASSAKLRSIFTRSKGKERSCVPAAIKRRIAVGFSTS